MYPIDFYLSAWFTAWGFALEGCGNSGGALMGEICQRG